jgi:hypothetical protein
MCSNLNPSGCHPLESRVRSKVHAQVRGGADRKGLECTSLAAYSTLKQTEKELCGKPCP